MNKKVLITGASGQLGNAVCNQLQGKIEILATDLDRGSIDIPFAYMDSTIPNQVKNVFEEFKPDTVLNLAAYTDVDGCELNPEEAYLANTKSVEHILDIFDGHFIQISSDYVFDGYDGPYSEDDDVNPLSIYGKTKVAAENILEASNIDVCILRTNVLFDYYSNTEASFLNWIIKSLMSKEAIHVVDDQWNNPTWTINLAEIIEQTIRNNEIGLYHYGGADYLTRYEFVKIVADIYHLDKSLINRVSTESLGQSAPRPLKGGLKTEKIENKYGIKCVNLVDSLTKIKIRMNL